VSVLLSSSVETLLLKTLRAWSNESSRQKLTEALSSQSATLEDLKEELLQARSSESERLASLREELRARSDCIAELQSRDSDRCLELENLLAESRQQTSRAKTEAQEEHAAPAFDSASAQARAMELAYGRREEATRRMLSSLFASQLESLLRQVMDAWRAAKAERLQLDSVEKQTQEVEMMRTQLQDL
ncbi:unnamed protein product, partial [Durusdinium trenchii]